MLIKEAGMNMLPVLWQVRSMAMWLAHSGHAARVLEAAQALYGTINESNARWYKGLVAQNAAEAYVQLGDLENAAMWATRCVELWSVCTSQDKAVAASTRIRVETAIKDEWGEKELEEAIERWEMAISREIQENLLECAIEKLEVITPLLTKRRDGRLRGLLNKVEGLVRQLPANSEAGDLKLANYYQSLAVASGLSGPKLLDEADELLDRAVQLYLKHSRVMEAANTRQLQAMVSLERFQRQQTRGSLERCMALVSVALEGFRALGITVMIVNATYWRAHFAFLQYLRGWTLSGTALEYLLEAEAARNDERVEMSIFNGPEALSRKQAMRADQKTLAIFRMALKICRMEALPICMWDLTQRFKARSLSDLLGLRVLTPAHLKSEIEEIQEARELFEKESGLFQDIKAAQGADCLVYRGELHVIQGRMKEFEPLKSLLDLRDGTPIQLPRLQDLARSARERLDLGNVVFVDWVFSENNLLLVLVRNDETPRIECCDMAYAEVSLWALRFARRQGEGGLELDPDEWEEDDPDYALRHLDALVSPVMKVAEEGDLLILCATGVLHSLPLHALWVEEDEPLIVRNPVVYCASMTTFAQCWQRSLDIVHAIPSERMAVMAAYEDLGHDDKFSPAEQSRVYQAIDQLGSEIGANVVSRGEGNLEHLKESVEKSSLFHFHGHCKFDREHVTDQALVLTDGEVPVKDIFSLNLNGLHITLIACDSASQGVSTGDEPLGLVTAFLCAGASSILGTMWPIESATGRQFSERFYKYFMASIREGGSGNVVNIANALKDAVLEMRRNRAMRQPYHWAAFVLHGSPMFRL